MHARTIWHISTNCHAWTQRQASCSQIQVQFQLILKKGSGS